VTYDPHIGDGPESDGGSRRASRLDAKLLVGLLGFAIALIAASAVSFAGEAGEGELDEALLGPRADSTVRGDIYRLEANAGGRYSVRRGGEVELDGSASKPARKITSYTWTFFSSGGIASARGGGGGCPVNPRPGSKSGKTPEVDALCDITATLTVSDGRTSDTDTARINVKPRNFKVPFGQVGEVEKQLPFLVPGNQFFGANRCSYERRRAITATDHWIHPADDQGNRKRFELDQVNDPGGPFNNFWYVRDLDVEVLRMRIINSRLLEGGNVFRLNRDQAHKQDLASVVESTRDHERFHSQLASQRMRNREFEAMVREIERAADRDQGNLRLLTGGLIGNLENDLADASSESNVMAKMQEKYGNQTATIVVPVSQSDPEERTYVLADIG
jgi:hypothetical protein